MTRLSVVTTSLLLLFIPVASQQTTDSNGENPSIYRGSGQYRYHGCFNETTQTPDSAEERALTGGSHLVEAGKMTVPLCLEFCASNGTQYQYAGLEWSRLSTKLDDDECKNPCEGGDTPDRAAMLQIPGGMAVLSILSVLFLWSLYRSSPNILSSALLAILFNYHIQPLNQFGSLFQIALFLNYSFKILFQDIQVPTMRTVFSRFRMPRIQHIFDLLC
ncbi:hypothetical protein HG530_005065 [Fusarium avenaceum]|nr:hypothetical protein HG530_005065 [Fusarium avenaceum]